MAQVQLLAEVSSWLTHRIWVVEIESNDAAALRLGQPIRLGQTWNLSSSSATEMSSLPFKECGQLKSEFIILI